MKTESMKHTVMLLLLFTGVFHLIVSATGAPADIRVPLAVFGLLYFGLGLWTRMGGRTAMLMVMVVTALGLGLGGSNYLQNGGPVTLPVMFLIDIAVLALGGAWLMRTKTAG